MIREIKTKIPKKLFYNIISYILYRANIVKSGFVSGAQINEKLYVVPGAAILTSTSLLHPVFVDESCIRLIRCLVYINNSIVFTGNYKNVFTLFFCILFLEYIVFLTIVP